MEELFMRHIYVDPSRLDSGWHQQRLQGDFRRQWERLLHLSRFLDERERVLLEAVYEQEGRVSRLARLTRSSPANLRRRIQDITHRLTRHELHALLKYPDAFSGFEQACLRDHLVRKRPLERVARDLGATVYEVRKTLTRVRAKTERLNETPPPRK